MSAKFRFLAAFECVDPPPLGYNLSVNTHIVIHCIVFFSLAACLAIPRNQWLNRYDQIEMRRMPRSRRHHQKVTRVASITIQPRPAVPRILLLLFFVGFRGTYGMLIERLQ